MFCKNEGNLNDKSLHVLNLFLSGMQIVFLLQDNPNFPRLKSLKE